MDESQHQTTQHEVRDVRYGPVVAAGAGLIGLIVAAVLLMLPFMDVLAVREAGKSEPASPLAGVIGRRQPPQPRLQTHPLDDLRALREAEDAALAEYGWVDEDAGIMRIPIERAIDLLVSKAPPAGRTP